MILIIPKPLEYIIHVSYNHTHNDMYPIRYVMIRYIFYYAHLMIFYFKKTTFTNFRYFQDIYRLFSSREMVWLSCCIISTAWTFLWPQNLQISLVCHVLMMKPLIKSRIECINLCWIMTVDTCFGENSTCMKCLKQNTKFFNRSVHSLTPIFPSLSDMLIVTFRHSLSWTTNSSCSTNDALITQLQLLKYLLHIYQGVHIKQICK